MDHLVYLDAEAGELEELQRGRKTMLVRGSTERKVPHGKVQEGDVLYFARDDAEGVLARATVKRAMSSPMLSPEASAEMVAEHAMQLSLTEKQAKECAGKRYLVIVEVQGFEPFDSWPFDRSAFGSEEDWVLVEDIAKVKK